jgi:DNA-binding NarL/FixJ family response regulator
VNTPRLLLADGQRLVLAGLRRLLDDFGRVQVIGETVSGREAVEMAIAGHPDLVLIEVAMPELNGIDAAARIIEALPCCRILMLSAQVCDGAVQAAFKAGATGVLLKDASPRELRGAIESTLAGRIYLSAALRPACVRASSPEAAFVRLSCRQREVLQLIAEGRSTREISAMLRVSVKTVETHRAVVMVKLGVDGIAGLVTYAIREHLIQ